MLSKENEKIEKSIFESEEWECFVKPILDTLSPRERRVVELRKEGKTLQEIGVEYNISRERVRQIEKHALYKIEGRKRKYTKEYVLKIFKKLSPMVKQENNEWNLIVAREKATITLREAEALKYWFNGGFEL